jgi:AAA+ ATPase superfamily predicted ATPase
MCQTIATTDFVNRSEEVDKLHSLFDSENADLAVVCGRRRLGKTRLVDIVTVLGAVLVVAIVALFTALPT